jgi:hypothetical protein
MSVTRYALWLLPDAMVSDTFDEIIVRLSARYQGPHFAPHVTLLGWVTGSEPQLAEATAQLAQQLRVLHLRAPVSTESSIIFAVSTSSSRHRKS